MSGIYTFEALHDEQLIQVKMLPSNISIHDIMAFDIESTGTDPKTSVATILGGTYFDSNGIPRTTQFFLNSKENEKELFEDFSRLIENKKYFISFNGDSFDIPYIQYKLSQYGLNPITFINPDGLDLYKWAKKFQAAHIKILRNKGVPEQKIKRPFGTRLTLKAIEIFANIQREDTVFGVTMIEKYHLYEFYYRTALVEDEEEFMIRLAMVKDKDIYDIYLKGDNHETRKYLMNAANHLKEELLLHNREDTLNLLELFARLSPKVYGKQDQDNKEHDE